MVFLEEDMMEAIEELSNFPTQPYYLFQYTPIEHNKNSLILQQPSIP